MQKLQTLGIFLAFCALLVKTARTVIENRRREDLERDRETVCSRCTAEPEDCRSCFGRDDASRFR